MTTSNKSVTKHDLKKVFWRSMSMEYSWNYERQMHMGFAHMMIPILKKLYKNDPEKLSDALKRHLEFFNVTSALSPFIGGITAAMEEKNANSDDFDTTSINAVKASLMGPLSGLGDSIFLGTLRVLGTGIGVSLAVKGNILGPLLFLLIYNVPNFLTRYFGAMKGYQLGTNFLTKIQESGLMSKVMFAAAVLGVMVVGGMSNSLVTVSTPITFGVGKAMTKLQDILDGIMPGMLSLGFVWLFYYLNSKKVNVIWMILGTIILGVICAAGGIFTVA